MRDGNAKRAARQNGKRGKRHATGDNGSDGAGARSSTAVERRQRLVVRRIDIRSIVKLSLVFYLSLSCVLLVAAMLLWAVATVSGVRGNVEKFIGDLVVAENFQLVGTKMLLLGGLMGLALVVVGTAANLVMATLYNLISDVIGGLSVVVEGSRMTAGPSGALELDDVDEADLRPARRPEAVSRRR